MAVILSWNESLHQTRHGTDRDSIDSVREQLDRTFDERFYIDDEPLTVADEIRRPSFGGSGRRFRQLPPIREPQRPSGVHPPKQEAGEATPLRLLPLTKQPLADIFSVGVSEEACPGGRHATALQLQRTDGEGVQIVVIGALRPPDPTPHQPPHRPKINQRLSADTLQEIADQYGDGTPTTSAYDRVQHRDGTVLRILEARGVQLRN